MSWEPPERFVCDSNPPYERRVYLPGYETLDPSSLPWPEMRKHPQHFPHFHMAKIASARTVAGLDFEPPGQAPRRIYVKRSYVRSPIKRLFSLWQASKEWREFQLALEFSQRGITVPEPVYYAEISEGHPFPTRYLATTALGTRWIPAREVFNSRTDFDERWESLAEFTRRLHRLSLFHADYRADHVFLDPEAPEPAWSLIDLDGSRTAHVPRPHEVRRALLQLAESLVPSSIGAAEIRRFLAAYDPEGNLDFDARELTAMAYERRHAKSLRPPGKKKKS